MSARNGVDRALAARVLPEGRVVIVTGAGQGIGRIFAHRLAEAGAVPVIAERDGDRGAAVAAEIAKSGRTALAVETDVAVPESVTAMVDRVLESFGRLDVLVNNAAVFSSIEMHPFDEIPLDEWRRVMEVNVTGCFLCARAVAGPMRRAGFGRIVNMSSGAVTLGRPHYLHYTTSKAALVGMTRSLARELGGHGITVNAILPGATITEIPRETVTPAALEHIVAAQCIPRPQTPEDLVGLVLFLASDMSGFLTGQSITVDGGATHP